MAAATEKHILKEMLKHSFVLVYWDIFPHIIDHTT